VNEMNEIVVTLFDVEVNFHDQKTTNGLTRLISSKELLKLFGSISIESPELRMKIEHLNKGETEHHLKGNLKLTIQL